MRGIALKIFLSFWLIFAVMIASFAVLPSRGPSVRFVDHVQQNGRFAAAILEEHSAAECNDYLAVAESQGRVSMVLFDATRRPLCSSPRADVANLAADPAGLAANEDGRREGTRAQVSVTGPSGTSYVAAAVSRRGFSAMSVRPPFPYGEVGLAILVSGLVCFAMARYLARPLQRIRDASYRLAAGDLNARVGASVGRRSDEIGDLVRDFDAMAGRIEALVHSQSQLLSDMSHELRSPLARLNVALALARRKAGSDAHADLDRIEVEADRMNELIGRILALARAEHATPNAPSTVVDLTSIVRGVTDDAQFEAGQQGKSVVLHAQGPVELAADAPLIASAVDNVVRNGVRHTGANTQVDVTVERHDREAIVRVRDHGPGVPDADRERIFSPFHRVEAHRNRDTGGVGLGLAIARRAVAVHGGAIGAENADGGGLCVTIRLPLQRPTSPA